MLVSFKSSGGFSLVEIMVGMTIGLLGMLVMLQMLTFSEGQKRTTSGSDDAQNAGAIALYGLQRDIQQSGYGISAQNLIGCSVTWTAATDGSSVTVPFAPVTINPTIIPAAASDPNTDTLLVIYGNSNSPEEGDSINAQPSQTNYTTGTPTSYNPNDSVIAQYAARQSPCTLILDRVNSTYSPATNPVIVVTGVSGMTIASSVLPTLYNIGQSPKVQAYAVRNGNLTACDYMQYNCGSAAYATINTANQSVWIPIAGNIASLKAQYGRDTNAGTMTGIVDTYDQSTQTTACNLVRTSAIRIALVSIGNMDTTNVTNAAPIWDGTATVAAAPPLPGNVANAIVLSGIPGVTTKWQKYHYKLFQTTVPLRNITTQGVVSGC